MGFSVKQMPGVLASRQPGDLRHFAEGLGVPWIPEYLKRNTMVVSRHLPCLGGGFAR